ncbi:hypothetical protein [Nocardioides nanhaiensis]|uniref:hypothetical protein n=1 Tax=Nocardioides nanhaiensis TaxID=1476871 RepID=UPI0031EBD475
MLRIRQRDPFGALDAVVSVLFFFALASFAVFLALGLIGLLDGGRAQVHVAGLGDGETCLEVPNNNRYVPFTDTRRTPRAENAGISVTAEELRVCLDDATPTQEAAAAVAPVGSLVLGLGGLFLARRAIRAGRREGFSSLALANAVRLTGWFLVVMTIAWPVLAAVARQVALGPVGAESTWADILLEPPGHLGMAIMSLGVLTTAGLLRHAVRLQADVDATI